MFNIFGLSFQLPFEDREFKMFAYITKEYGREIVAAILFLDLQNQMVHTLEISIPYILKLISSHYKPS